MVEVTVEKVFELATKALEGQGFRAQVAQDIAKELVVAEIAGVSTHGLGKLVSLNLGDLDANPTIVEHGGLISINGNGGNGFQLFQGVGQILVERCSQHGIVAALVHNYSRFSSLYPYTVRVAEAGYVGILTNSAGPPAVAPFGSVDPLTGTNPVCFSFPIGNEQVQTFDFATSEVVWGAIRQASLEGKALPSGPFFNSAGDITTVPTEVNAVRAFGGKKGFALNLAIEILAGILSGGRAGSQCETEFDCGALFIAIDPAVTNEDFAPAVANLLEEVRSSRPKDVSVPVRSPGDKGRNTISILQEKNRILAVPDATLRMMERMAAGESIAELASNSLFN